MGQCNDHCWSYWHTVAGIQLNISVSGYQIVVIRFSSKFLWALNTLTRFCTWCFCGRFLYSREILDTFSCLWGSFVFKGGNYCVGFPRECCEALLVPNGLNHLISGAPACDTGHGPGGITPHNSHPAVALPSPWPCWPYGAWLVPLGCHAWLVRLPAHIG